jgi:hypothetical protein
LDERIAAVLTIEGSLDGPLVIEIRPTDVHFTGDVARTVLMLSAWLEAGNGIRMSLRNPRTGTVAHLQSGESLIRFARECGIEVAR